MTRSKQTTQSARILYCSTREMCGKLAGYKCMCRGYSRATRACLFGNSLFPAAVKPWASLRFTGRVQFPNSQFLLFENQFRFGGSRTRAPYTRSFAILPVHFFHRSRPRLCSRFVPDGSGCQTNSARLMSSAPFRLGTVSRVHARMPPQRVRVFRCKDRSGCS